MVGSSGRCDQCVSGAVGEVQSHLLIPSPLTNSLSIAQNRGQRDPGHTSGPELASLFVVCRRDAVGGGHSLAATSSGGPSVYRAGLPPCFTIAGFDGMALES